MNSDHKKPSKVNNYETHTIDPEKLKQARKELHSLLSQGKDKGIDLVGWYDKWRVCFGDSDVQDIMDACFKEIENNDGG